MNLDIPDKNGNDLGVHTVHNLSRFPRRKLIGRSWEISRLKQFLFMGDNDEVSLPIMVVYGPQGVGKSTLVREAAWLAIESSKFKSVLWFSRERFTSFLLGDQDKLPIPNQPALEDKKLKLEDLIKSDAFEYIQFIHKKNPFQDDAERNSYYSFFRKFLAAYSPFLIIVDDFDENDNLNSEKLCKELERTHSPNKIILTSRLPRHAFSDGISDSFEVGLLGADEVKMLVEHDFGQIPSHQFLDQDIYRASQIVWEWSAGLPIFITQCLAPKLRESGWRLNKNNRWKKVCNEFAEKYIKIDINSLADDEKYVLIGLATQDHLQNLELKDLAFSLGFCAELDEENRFDEILKTLQQNGLVGIRCDHILNHKSITEISHYKWTLLPFTKEYVLEKLFSFRMDQFNVLQVELWSRQLELYKENPRRIESYLEYLITVFWEHSEKEDWYRAIKLGNLLSEIMWSLNYHTSSEHKKRYQFESLSNRLIIGCQEIMDWHGLVQHLTKISYFYLNTNEISKAAVFSEQAVKLLSEAEGNKKITTEHWAATAYVVGNIQSKKGNSNESIEWYEKARKSFILQNDWENSAKSNINISREYIKTEQYDKAIDAACQAKENAINANVKELEITSIVIIAEVVKSQGRHDEYMELLRDAISLAATEGMLVLENNLKERLKSSQQEVPTNQVLSMVDMVMDSRLEWGQVDNQRLSETCPLCRNFLSSDGEFSTMVICNNCGVIYHQKCWDDFGRKCQICVPSN